MLHKNQTITITVHSEQVQVKQVNKTVARRLYNAGHNIHVVACNLRLNNPCYAPYTTTGGHAYSVLFDTMLNEFTYYNCDAERGYYPHFYAATHLL